MSAATSRGAAAPARQARIRIKAKPDMKPRSLWLPLLLAVLAGATVTAAPWVAWATPEARAEGRAPHEPHHRLDTSSPGHANDIALTLDACGGAYDSDLIATLVRLQVPATIFVTRRWLDANPAAVRELLAHPVLFEMVVICFADVIGSLSGFSISHCGQVIRQLAHPIHTVD